MTLFIEETGGLLAAVTWIGFGAWLSAGPCRTSPGRSCSTRCSVSRWCACCRSRWRWPDTGLRRPTVAFIGWFGPRGLASVVFALLAIERGVPEGQTVLAAVVVTVALSVLLHGLTSVPLVGA